MEPKIWQYPRGRVKSKAVTVLLDGMIRPWGVTHKWVLQDTTFTWGPRTFTLPMERVIPKPRLAPSHKWLQEQLDSLPRIAELAERGEIKCYSTDEIDFEAWGRPGVPGRGTEFDLFRSLMVEKIPPAIRRSFLWRHKEFKKSKEAFLDTIRDDRFLELKTAIGRAHAADIFHLWSAERAGRDCFLSADQKFINAVRNQRKTTINVCVLSPFELCERFPRFWFLPRRIERYRLRIHSFFAGALQRFGGAL